MDVIEVENEMVKVGSKVGLDEADLIVKEKNNTFIISTII